MVILAESRRVVTLLLIGLFLIGACVPAPPSSPQLPPTATAIPEELEVIEGDLMTQSTFDNPDAPNQVVRAAIKDLATRLDLHLAEVEIVSAENVIWPDTSMGCPRPGMAYRQVPQDGVRIVLRAGNQIFHYHSGGVRPPILCEHPGSAPDNPAEPAPES